MDDDLAAGSGEPDGARPPTVRLFAGVWPPDEVVQQLTALARPKASGVRWTTSAQWHVTVAFLGDVEETALEAVGTALAEAAASASAPVVRAGPATVRLGRSILCVPVTGLDALASATRAALAAVLPGAAPDEWPFGGHLTLARAHRRHAIPASLAGTPVDLVWRADRLSLVRSELDPAGARYTTLVQATVPS